MISVKCPLPCTVLYFQVLGIRMRTILSTRKEGLGSYCSVFGSLTQQNGPPDFLSNVYTTVIIARPLFLMCHSLTLKYSFARHSGHPKGRSFVIASHPGLKRELCVLVGCVYLPLPSVPCSVLHIPDATSSNCFCQIETLSSLIPAHPFYKI